jgi:hypothetical protein
MNDEAVSIIIGALMLTVIVVSAATAFALFTSQKQKELQTAEFSKLQRDLEKLEVLEIFQPQYDTNSLTNLSMKIGNMHTKQSMITSLRLNGYLLKEFIVQRQNLSNETWELNFTTGIYELNNSTMKYPLQLLSQERVTITITNTTTCLLKPVTETITTYDPLTIEITTTLSNTFSKTFYPPTAIIQIITESQWDPSTGDYKDFLILDGSSSDHPGDAYIISWKWMIDNSTNLHGRKVRAPDLTTGSHTITLTVTDNFGMRNSYTIPYP